MIDVRDPYGEEGPPDEDGPFPFTPDWLRTADLPWCRIVAARGRYFILRYHFGPLVVWIAPDAGNALWRARLVIRLWGWRP